LEGAQDKDTIFIYSFNFIAGMFALLANDFVLWRGQFESAIKPLKLRCEYLKNPLRVFLAWPGVTRHPQVGRYTIARRVWQETHKDFSEEEIWAWCREGLVESARYADDFGVTLALP
jgi:hypothetical protein